MKVGIITFHTALNCGAAIQAYALATIIRRLGYEPKIIDYRPKAIDRCYHFPRHPRRFGPHLIRKRRFGDFQKDFLPLTDRSYLTPSELEAIAGDFDILVAGSDQIWNPLLHDGFDPAYFLSFASTPPTRLVAYAPSFGGAQIPETLRAEITALLSRFACLSVREKQGQETISELCARSADITLDPTLLLDADDYETIASPPLPAREYIAVYPMDISEGLVAVTKTVARALKLPIVALGMLDFPGADLHWPAVGPREWLGAIKQAAFVCTNSFHGVALAIVLKKPFLVYPVRHRHFRIRELLTRLGLLAREISNPADLADDDPRFKTLDFSRSNENLAEARRESMDFLARSLSSPIKSEVPA